MAGRGPRRTPDKILTLRGSSMVSRKTGKRYDGKGIDASPGNEAAPKMLDGDALECWTRTVAGLKELGLFANTDRNLLTLYCRTWARWLKKPAALALVGELRRLGNELGLSPAARQRLKSDMKPVGDDAAAKKAKEYFGGGGHARSV